MDIRIHLGDLQAEECGGSSESYNRTSAQSSNFTSRYFTEKGNEFIKISVSPCLPHTVYSEAMDGWIKPCHTWILFSRQKGGLAIRDPWMDPEGVAE